MLAHLRVPARAVGQPSPTLVLLHGHGGSHMMFAPVSDSLPGAYAYWFLRGPVATPERAGGYTWWRMGDPESRAWWPSYRAGLDAVREALSIIRADPGTDPGRLLIGGFSAGAMLAAGLAAEGRDTLTGVVLLSGGVPPDASLPVTIAPLEGLSVFSGHGVRDKIVPVAHADHLADLLAAAGARVERHRYAMGHERSQEELDDLAAFLTRWT
jgi:phospholipase/carboxylesterase